MPSITAKQIELARETPLGHRITVRFHEAAILSGLPVTRLQQLVKDGTLRSTKVGRCRLIHVKSLLELLEGRAMRRKRRAG